MLQNEIANLKVLAKRKMPVTKYNGDVSKIYVSGKYDIDDVFVSRSLKNNKLAHYGYLTQFKNSLEMLRETVEEDRIVKPHDSAILDACFLTKRSQELLEYAFATCPREDKKQNEVTLSVPAHKNCQIALDVPLNKCVPSTSQIVKQTVASQTNVPIINSTGVICDTKVIKSKPKGNTRKDRTLPTKSDQGKSVEDHLRNNKFDLDKKNRVDSRNCFNQSAINSNSSAICKTCNECLIFANHD